MRRAGGLSWNLAVSSVAGSVAGRTISSQEQSASSLTSQSHYSLTGNNNRCSIMNRSGFVQMQTRGAATYGVTLLSHAELLERYSKKPNASTSGKDTSTPRSQEENYLGLMNCLEKVEQRLVMWRAGMWESRIPVLLAPQEVQRSKAQLARVKHETMGRLLRRDQRVGDMHLVCSLTNATEEEVRASGRNWLQEKVTELRWKGKVEEAKQVKDAWLNLEQEGARDAQLLERLCCIYGMAKLGTFESAFSNIISPKADYQQQTALDQSTKQSANSKSSFFGQVKGGSSSTENNFPVQFDGSNSFNQLMSLMLELFPNFDLMHDLRGYDVVDGYRPAVGQLLQQTLIEKHGLPSLPEGNNTAGFKKTDSRVLFQHRTPEGKSVVLFDNRVDGSGPDFVYLGPEKQISLVTIVSPNRYLRTGQVMPRQQMEGLARRYCFVFGVPFDEMKGVNQVSLPHDMMDLQAFERLESALDTPLCQAVRKWMPLFQGDLKSRQEIDFTDHLKRHPQDEWVKL